MSAYRRVYDSHHLQADCQQPGSAPEPTLGNRVWATFTFFYMLLQPVMMLMCRVVMSVEDEEEESRRCYERYRILVQNECAGGEF